MRNCWIFILLLIVGCQIGLGQVRILSGAALPDPPAPNMWFHDTVAHKMMHYADGEWKHMSDDERWKVTVCNDLIVFYDMGKNPTALDNFVIISDSLGNFIQSNVKEFICGERLLACRGNSWWRFLDSKKADPTDNMNIAMPFYEEDCGSYRPDTIGGELCFCTAQYVGIILEKVYCGEMRNWGILNGKGQWLIAPQFDYPFHFRKGIAEVVYYGQKRKINEKGEFVE